MLYIKLLVKQSLAGGNLGGYAVVATFRILYLQAMLSVQTSCILGTFNQQMEIVWTPVLDLICQLKG